MIAHKPKIGNRGDLRPGEGGGAKHSRDRVHVCGQPEDDNDFHLIIGRNPTATPEMYMTMELSGLPAKTEPSFTQLKATA